jgi:hypothetical protein
VPAPQLQVLDLSGVAECSEDSLMSLALACSGLEELMLNRCHQVT